MWQMNRITVGQEHFCTATTQLVISNLFPMLLSAKAGRFKLIAACVGDELHEVGLRIVTDLLELSGWTTRYLGANVPASSIVDAAIASDADVIALSVTLTPHLADAQRIVSALRLDPRTKAKKILVGGAPFQLDGELWKSIGADGWAPDGRAALPVIESLVM
jgi:methanogenic corrinoid protein MtbC1